MYNHFSDVKKLFKKFIYIWFYCFTVKVVKTLHLSSSPVSNNHFILLKYFLDDPTVRMLMYNHFSDLKKLFQKFVYIWFYFLTVKVDKTLHLTSSLVSNNHFIFSKYFLDDPTVRMLMYNHFSDVKKIIKNNNLYLV